MKYQRVGKYSVSGCSYENIDLTCANVVEEPIMTTGQNLQQFEQKQSVYISNELIWKTYGFNKMEW